MNKQTNEVVEVNSEDSILTKNLFAYVKEVFEKDAPCVGLAIDEPDSGNWYYFEAVDAKPVMDNQGILTEYWTFIVRCATTQRWHVVTYDRGQDFRHVGISPVITCGNYWSAWTVYKSRIDWIGAFYSEPCRPGEVREQRNVYETSLVTDAASGRIVLPGWQGGISEGIESILNRK